MLDPVILVVVDVAFEVLCNDHCLCSESQDVRRQVRWGGGGTGTMSCVLGKAVDRFQCTWVVMIGEIYGLIVGYLGNGFR